MASVGLGRIMILGSRGMVGSAIIRRLTKAPGVSEIIPVCREQVDLTNQKDTYNFIESKRPDWVVVAAAKVGGIHANNIYPKDFIFENLSIQLNTINGAFRAGVERLIFLGSSCIYPKYTEQPIKEESLLAGVLEPTNEAYAIAKIAGLKLCESFNRQYQTDYRSLMPTNLYGIGDTYHPTNSHVIPGLIRRFNASKLEDASLVTVWGTGTVRREFLFVDDLADAVVHVMNLSKKTIESIASTSASHLNVGTGSDCSIAELASLIKKIVEVDAEIYFDTTKPDGTPRKLLDTSRLERTGWSAQTPLHEGLKIAYSDFKQRYKCTG